MRTFLKWAGNKQGIVDRIRTALPPGGRLIEPFVGSGAVFLNVDYPSYRLSDTNPDLIALYTFLQREGESFMRLCRKLFDEKSNQKEVFLERRARFNDSADPREKAALFVYLNRHGFNGLCRYNSRHEFNVPFGRYSKVPFPEAPMKAFCERAKKAEFHCEHFAMALDSARKGDVVYCDPPYVPLSETASFTAYDSGRFGMQEQKLLAKVAKKLAARGVPVLISNHDTAFTRKAYAKAHFEHFAVRRSISCKGAKRGNAPELLALFQ